MRDDILFELIFAHHRCRQLLGYLGLALPPLLITSSAIADTGILPSVSDYYHSLSRDLLVGALFAIGVVLCTQSARRGSDSAGPGDPLVRLAGLAAIGVALFPNESGDNQNLIRLLLGSPLTALAHYLSAVLLLSGLAYLCLCHFPRRATAIPRRIYRACGLFILLGGAVATMASVVKLVGPPDLRDFVLGYNVVFWVEALGIWAFGLSWLVKNRCDMRAIRSLHPVTTRAGQLVVAPGKIAV